MFDVRWRPLKCARLDEEPLASAAGHKNGQREFCRAQEASRHGIGTDAGAERPSPEGYAAIALVWGEEADRPAPQW